VSRANPDLTIAEMCRVLATADLLADWERAAWESGKSSD
jgi:hypothetical protein